MQIRRRPCERSKGVSSLWPYHWEMLGASLESDCRGSLCWLFNCKSEDYAKRVRLWAGLPQFQTLIGVWGGHPNTSRLSKDLQDGPLIMALGNGP